MSLGYEDCKVYISNVDCQGSAESGILVQVIGEMSNRGGPWRKFVQTFFLACQEAGYFVLNDIQRYIKDEGEEEEDESLPYVAAVNPATTPAAPVIAEQLHADFEQASETDVAESVVDAPIDAPRVNGNANGTHHGTLHDEAPPSPISLPPPSPKAQPVVESIPEPVVAAPIVAPAPLVETTLPVVIEEPATLPSPVAQESIPLPTPSIPTPSAPTPAPTPTVIPTPAPAVAPVVQAPAAPVAKSWADLAGAKAKQAPAAKVAAAAASSSAPPATSSSATTSTQNRPVLLPVVLAINSTACFVKGVVETVNEKALKDQLTLRYGPVRELDVVRSKACAFVEFEKVDGARRAIQASMRPTEGGEGGLIIGSDLMHVVTKASPGNRPSSSTRGGRNPGEGRANAAGEGRSGGEGGRGEGRGNNAGTTSTPKAGGNRNAGNATGAGASTGGATTTTEEGATPKAKGKNNGNRAKGNKGTATPAKLS